MRLPVDGRTAHFAKLAAALIPALALGACGIVGGGSGPAEGLAATVVPSYGPQGDYPVWSGSPMTSPDAYTPRT